MNSISMPRATPPCVAVLLLSVHQATLTVAATIAHQADTSLPAIPAGKI